MRHHQKASRARRLIAAVAGVLASGLVLAGCSAAPAEPSPSPESRTSADALLAEYGLTGLDAASIVERLDAMPLTDRPDDLMASVRSDVLVLAGSQSREVALPMPADQMYVSVAPYQLQTHECYYHSLTTCAGELREVEMQVTIVDDATGDVLVDESRLSYDNGFIGFWLPRDIKATLTVDYEGTTGTAELSSVDDGDPTCITTMQLT